MNNDAASYDIVIHGGTVVTANAGGDIIEDGLICIRRDRLERVQRRKPGRPLPPAARIIDAAGGIICPGLINTHTHLPMSLFRGLADDLPLNRWLNDHIFPAEAAHIDPDSVRAGTRLAAAEMIRSGTTTCCDGYFLEDHVAEAVEAAGLRAVLGQGVIDFPAPGVPEPSGNVAAAAGFMQRWNDRCPRVRTGVFCHSPYTCSADTLKTARQAADWHGGLFQIHVSETRAERDRIVAAHGTTPVQYLDRLGVLNENTLLVHCVWLTTADIECIARRGCRVSHNPESNAKLAGGIAPLIELLEAGVPVGLGTDGCASNNDLDLFGAMDFAAKLHKVHRADPTAAGADVVLHAATRGGAGSLGLAEQTGSLEVGKKADLIVLDSAAPHLVPLYNPVSQLVYAARGADVRWTVVDGRLLMDDRRLLTIDVDDAMDRVRRLARRIADRS